MATRGRNRVEDLELERQGRRMARPASRFLLIGLVMAVPGVVLVALAYDWSIGIGAAILLLASIPTVFGVALLVSSGVARWAARHNLFA